MPNKITIQCDAESIESVQLYVEKCMQEFHENHANLKYSVDLNYDTNRAGDKTIKVTSE